MKEKILILSVMKYEKEGKQKSRLAFILAEEKNITSSDKFKGYKDLAFYYEDTKAFDNLPVDLIGQVVEGTFVEIPSVGNPFKKNTILSEIDFNGKSYKLC